MAKCALGRAAVVWLVLVGTFISWPVHSQSLFACKQGDGPVHIQSTPCPGTTVAQEKRPPTEGEQLMKSAAEAQAAQRAREEEEAKHPSRLKQYAPYSCADNSMIGTASYDLEQECGSPISKNVSGGAYGKHEQWVYGGGIYLYLENGHMTSFQSSHN